MGYGEERGGKVQNGRGNGWIGMFKEMGIYGTKKSFIRDLRRRNSLAKYYISV